jgi:ribosomal protein L37E
MRRNGSDVALIDRCRFDRRVWPANDVAISDLLSPPIPGVRREHPRPENRCRESGCGKKSLDFSKHIAHSIRLLKERMRSPEWSREKNDSRRRRGESIDGARGGSDRRGPQKKHRADIAECVVE